jgi:DNA adenine methylase
MRHSEALHAIVERLAGVVIENRDAMDVMAAHDGPETLHFVDPPYLPETRTNPGRGYNFEMSFEDHVALLAFLHGLKGTVVLCGYPSTYYDWALSGWHRVTRNALADGARPRLEVLWINRPPAADLLSRLAS